MNRNWARLIAIAAAIIGLSAATRGEIRVGVTTAVNPSAVGIPPQQEERVLYVGIDMLANERVVTGPAGRAHLLFLDGSNLSVGPDSDVVIDRFVYDPQTKTGELAFSAARGVFRFVGGKISKTSEVQFRTPAAVVGLRGGITSHDLQTGQPEKHTLLHGDRMRVTAGGETKSVTLPGFKISIPVATGGGARQPPPTDPVRAASIEIQASLKPFESKATGSPAESAKAPDSGASQSGIVPAAGASGEQAPAATGGPSTAAAGGETSPAAAPDLAAGNIESGVAGVSDVNSAAPPAPPPPAPPASGNTDTKIVSDTSNQTTAATNAAPQLAAVNVNAVPENSSPGTLAGSVTFTDPNAGQTLTYSIVGGNTGNAFAINPVTGAISVNNPAALNFESQSSFNLTVQATDSAGLSGTPATVTVNLGNVNEAPLFGALPPLGVVENATAGAPVGSVGASDPDAGQTLTYSIVGGNTGDAFAINPATGAISVNNSAALDFETNPNFNLTVQATDSGGLSAQVTIPVTLNDVSEGPTQFVGRFLRDSPFTAFNQDTGAAPRYLNNNAVLRAEVFSVGGVQRLRVNIDGPTGGPHDFPYATASSPLGSGFTILEGQSTTLFGGNAGDGYVSADGQFLAYVFTNNLGLSNGEVSAGFFAGVPTANFPTDGAARHNLLRFGYVNIPAAQVVPIPFTDLDCFLINCGAIGVHTAVSPLYSRYSPILTFAQADGNDQRAVHLQATLGIIGSGADQKSFLVGETGTYFVEDNAGETVAFIGAARGSYRESATDFPIRIASALSSAEVGAPGSGTVNAIFGPNGEYMVLTPERLSVNANSLVRTPSAGFTQRLDDLIFDPYYQVDVAAPLSPPTFAPRSNRTLSGFFAGLVETREANGTFNQETFEGTASITTSADNNRVQASFVVQEAGNPYPPVIEFGDITGANRTRSAFIDDNIFAAQQSFSRPTMVDGTTILDADSRIFMVTSNTVPLTAIDGVQPCACDFLKWGWWGGEVVERVDGVEVARHRVHLATWVAGVVPTLAELPITGVATYGGHAIGNVLNGTAKYIATGTYTQSWDFSQQAVVKGSATISGFDKLGSGVPGGNGITVSGNLTANAAAGFTGNLNNATTPAGLPTTTGFTGAIAGSLFRDATVTSGAGVGGNFTINGNGGAYNAAGTFAAGQKTFAP